MKRWRWRIRYENARGEVKECMARERTILAALRYSGAHGYRVVSAQLERHTDD